MKYVTVREEKNGDRYRDLEREKEEYRRQLNNLRDHLAAEECEERRQYDIIMKMREECDPKDRDTLGVLEGLEENLKKMQNCRLELMSELVKDERKKQLEWNMREDDIREEQERAANQEDEEKS